MRFREALQQKSFSLVVQMDPPKGVDVSSLLNTALSVRGRVDAINFTNCPLAIMRMHPLAPASLLRQKNMDAVLSMNTRDGNRLGLQSGVLAASALGVQSFLFVEGEDPSFGDHPLAVPCKDLTLEGMLEAAAALAQGKDLSEQPVVPAPEVHAGVFVPITDDKKANERKAAELSKWARLGARFLVLGTTYDLETVRTFSDAAQGTGLKVLASVLMLKSVGMAKYLNNMKGVPNIPDDLIDRMKKAPIKSKGGLEIAADFMHQLESVCQGAVIVPLGWESKVPELLDLFEQ